MDTTCGSTMAVPGRTSLKSTSGLYCATSHTGGHPQERREQKRERRQLGYLT